MRRSPPSKTPLFPKDFLRFLRCRTPVLLVIVSLCLGACAGSPLGDRLEQALTPGSTEPAPETPLDTFSEDPTEASPRDSQTPEPPDGDGSSLPESAASPSQLPTPNAPLPNSELPTPNSPNSEAGLETSSGNGSATVSSDLTALTSANTSTRFRDLGEAPPALQSALKEMSALGVLTAISEDSAETQDPAFAPNQIATRRVFCRWLVTTHNQLYQNRPGRQIRLAAPNDAPVFQDLPRTDPDFEVIQGLAAAGFIASPLTGAANPNQFQPDAPLTRETLVQWKVAVETESVLPIASIEAIQQTWGFQDAARISGAALGAVLVDFQNGELSNIRRVFGYTTLFQPQKPVTRGEAAVALWYFGQQGQGISVADVSGNRDNSSESN